MNEYLEGFFYLQKKKKKHNKVEQNRPKQTNLVYAVIIIVSSNHQMRKVRYHTSLPLLPLPISPSPRKQNMLFQLLHFLKMCDIVSMLEIHSSNFINAFVNVNLFLYTIDHIL